MGFGQHDIVLIVVLKLLGQGSRNPILHFRGEHFPGSRNFDAQFSAIATFCETVFVEDSSYFPFVHPFASFIRRFAHGIR